MDVIHRQKNMKMILFHGYWCPFTHSEVPKINQIFMRLKQEVDIDFVIVDQQHQDPQGISKQYGVDDIPMIVILIDGQMAAKVGGWGTWNWDQDISKALLEYETKQVKANTNEV